MIVRRQFRAPRQKHTAPQVARVARLLALAHHIERRIESGKLRDYAEAARVLGLTRARMTQVMNLLLLSPDIQGRLVTGELCDSERALRAVIREPEWTDQQISTSDPRSTQR